MKHCAHVRRYMYRDHLLFWTSFHVPVPAKSVPTSQLAGDTCSPTIQPHRDPSISAPP